MPARPAINPRTFLKRLFSWVLLWVIALWFVFCGWDTGCLLLIAFFGLAGQWEFYRAQEEKGHKVFKQSGLFCGALIFANSWYFLIHRPHDAHFVHFGSELVLVFSLLGAFIRLVVVPEAHRAPITTAALTLLGLLYVPFLFNFVALLAFLPGDPEQNRFLLIYLLAVTKFSDVGAYVVGSLFGKHKMIPRISPGKTWEGFAGAMLTYMGQRVGNFQPVGTDRQVFPAYVKTDLRAGARYQSWLFNFYLNNVADRRGQLGGGVDGFPTNAIIYIQPRTTGISIAKTFK